MFLFIVMFFGLVLVCDLGLLWVCFGFIACFCLCLVFTWFWLPVAGVFVSSV